MLLVAVVVLSFAGIVVMYQQSDYILLMERVEVVSCNYKYVNVTIRNFKFNRTATSFNCTWDFKRDFGTQIKMNLQAFKFASNEYRLFPLVFSMNLCEALASNDYGLKNMYKCGNAPKCPILKGHYSMCNWEPDYSKFPPYIPLGQYRMDLNFVYLSEELYTLQFYMKINSVKWG